MGLPLYTFAEVGKLARANPVPDKYRVRVFAIRSDADRPGYDDALIVACGNGITQYDARVDPSVERRPDGSRTFTVEPGTYLMGQGHDPHRPDSLVFRQAGPMDIRNHDEPFGNIMIHAGPDSYGCFVVRPKEWFAFRGFLNFILIETDAPMAHNDAGLWDPSRPKVRTFPVTVLPQLIPTVPSYL